jgi:hypothetical protein
MVQVRKHNYDQSADNGGRRTSDPDVEQLVRAHWIDQNPHNETAYHSQSDGELGNIKQEIMHKKQEFDSELQTGELLIRHCGTTVQCDGESQNVKCET